MIMPLGFANAGRIAIADLQAGDATPLQIVDFGDALVGLTDLYDPGNGPSPDLTPVGIDGDRLLLIARSDWALGRGSPLPSEGEPVWRAWMADLSTGSVALVGYGNGRPKAE